MTSTSGVRRPAFRARKQAAGGAARRRPGGAAEMWGQRMSQQPLAVTVEQAAARLGVPLSMVRRAAARIEPYRHADGSPRWPLRELARWLARGTGRVVPP
jgi:hypothetical protein